jgi:hypothetical protein
MVEANGVNEPLLKVVINMRASTYLTRSQGWVRSLGNLAISIVGATKKMRDTGTVR